MHADDSYYILHVEDGVQETISKSNFLVRNGKAQKVRVSKRLSYSMVVLYIGIIKVWGFWPKIIPPKQLDIYFLTLWEHWLDVGKPKNVFRSILNPSIK